MSLASSRSGCDGAPGAVVSTVTLSGEDAGEVLPAVSFSVAVTAHVPSAIVPRLQPVTPTAAVKVQMTSGEPALVAVMVYVLPLVSVPGRLMVGVLLLVTLSVLLVPVSLAVARSGRPGADGAAVSMVTLRGEDAAEVLPAASVSVAVTLQAPSAMTLGMVQLAGVAP